MSFSFSGFGGGKSSFNSENNNPPILLSSVLNSESIITAATSKAVKRLNDKIVDILVNVKDFGAKGDGVTDDTQAIKDAINYAQTINGTNSIKRKSVIYFPNGTYIVSEKIMFRWYMIIQGENIHLSKIMAKNNANLDYILTTVGSMNATIKSITLDGNKTNNGSRGGLLIQGTDQYKNLNFHVQYLFVQNCVDNGVDMLYPCFGVKIYDIQVYNCDGYGLYDRSTDNKIYQIELWACKKGGLYVGGAHNHYVGGKCSYNGTLGDYTTANMIITNTRNIFTSIDTQEGLAHGVIMQDAFDNILNGVTSDCNGDKNLTVSDSCGFIMVRSKNNIMNIASTNGFYGSYPNCQYYGLKADADSHSNVINYIHSRQAVPLQLDNYHNILNGIDLAKEIIEKHKYDNKGVLYNKFVNSKFDSTSSWVGGYRTSLAVSNNTASFTTTGPFARLSQNFIPESGKTYFFKCMLKTNEPSSIALGIDGFSSKKTVRPVANEFGEMYSIVTIPPDSFLTSTKAFGLYIIKDELVIEVKNMACYELTEELSKLTCDELYEIVSYNNMNIHGNNDIGLGNGYKLSQIFTV